MTSDADIKFLHDRIDRLTKQVERLKTNAAPTIPIYDVSGGSTIASSLGDVPQDAIEGQVAIGTDSAIHMYRNGAWRTAGSSTAHSTAAEEHLYAAEFTLASEISTTISWVNYDGLSFMNLGISTRVKATVDAVYAVSMQLTVFQPNGNPPDGGIEAHITPVQLAGPAWPPSWLSPAYINFADPGNTDAWEASVSDVAILRLNDWWEAGVTNYNSFSISVLAALRVVKILEIV